MKTQETVESHYSYDDYTTEELEKIEKCCVLTSDIEGYIYPFLPEVDVLRGILSEREMKQNGTLEYSLENLQHLSKHSWRVDFFKGMLLERERRQNNKLKNSLKNLEYLNKLIDILDQILIEFHELEYKELKKSDWLFTCHCWSDDIIRNWKLILKKNNKKCKTLLKQYLTTQYNLFSN